MQTSRFGYTFIELMIVITLVFIVTMMTYLPYSYYQNKMKIKQTGKEIAQLLYDARNDALNGYIS
ncbi:MAG: prepilin-type N-terminal cleavage/methylation domain-containing protein [Candidatus Peribacteria bacterium]|nr:MAG: prepilin-type N-terminal cleavage/methylation domain-containing protein [Candidatus Peribacteria bacterium]